MDLFFVLLVLLSTISYAIQKKVIVNLTLIEFWILYSIISFALAMIFLCLTNTCTTTKINLLDKIKDNNGLNWMVLSLVLIVILTSVSGVCQMKYLEKTDLGVFMTISKSLAIVLAFALGIIINNELPCMKQVCGAAIIIGGVFLISSGVKK